MSAALIADASSHMKMACLDPKATARIAILDPELTVSMSPKVTACTGIDAIAHAVETAVTSKRNAISLMYSHEAFKLLAPNLPKVLRDPGDLAARGRMSRPPWPAWPSNSSMLGVAHSAANPLTAHFNVIHGTAVGLMLPHVVRFNAADPNVRLAYAELASAPEIACVSEGLDHAVNALIAYLNQLLDHCGVPHSLAEAGASPELIRSNGGGGRKAMDRQLQSALGDRVGLRGSLPQRAAAAPLSGSPLHMI